MLPMTMPLSRSLRFQRIRDLLRARSCTPRELAELTGVTVRSIQRDLAAIEYELNEPLERQNGRYALRRGEHLPRLDLTLHEARALMVAVRLFVRYSDEGDPHAGSAMQALARIMPPDVRPQVMAAAESIERRPIDTRFARNLTDITEAWARRRVIRISYRSAGKGRAKDIEMEPYFIEPGAAGMATYLIGYSRTHGSIRTFKVERIVSVVKLAESFEVPPDLNLDTLLSSAWGIIWGEGIGVVLRFSPDVTWRVKETTWHPSQSIDELPNGGCIMRISVASMMELGRWVRGWGDKVEVLEPSELREELRLEAVRLARLYSKPARTPKRRRAVRTPTKLVPQGQGVLPDSVA